MKALILDGSHANDVQASNIRRALEVQLPSAETIVLREQKIGPCAGEFDCWLRSPGMCHTDDDNRIIAARIIRSDLVVFLTPVTFGGYSSELKRMVDHHIQNISPFFADIQGETHHRKRYSRYPDMLVIGWMDEPNARAEAIFRHLAARNAINMHSAASVCEVVVGSPSADEIIRQTALWLKAVADRSAGSASFLAPAEILLAGAAQIRRVVLLAGSPRREKSTSYATGRYLLEQLETRGCKTRTIQIHASVHSQERLRAMLDSIDEADLAVLAFPLYIDNLPAPVIAALERIAAHRKERSYDARFAAIVNSGFPEASQNDVALAICSEFARQSGFAWMGGLALGGGEGLVHGMPLGELGGRGARLRKSLVLAAEALAQGHPVPPSAQALLSKPVVPGWLYRFMGGIGWKQKAKRFGTAQHMDRQPYL